MLPKIPKFSYGSGPTELTLTYPARVWVPADETIGGVAISAAGIPATYLVRRDDLLLLVVRATEAEWADVRGLVIFGQTGGVITWFPDAGEATSFAVYLQEPAPGTRWTPTRSADYPRVFEVALTLRGAGSTPWTPYFTE